jgi:diguanylate cyclase (GGDEF)-like protein
MLLLLLVGSFVLNISTMRSYIQNQLQSHAQDTATSLGLSLSTSVNAKDQVVSSRIIDSIFDSGDYRKIVFFDIKGAPIVIRSNSLAVESVPDWFVSLIDLTAPSKTAQVVAGWNQLGTVVVESHPGYAYIELWEVIRSESIWFVSILVVGLFAARWLLMGVLKPLKQLQSHAREMSQRHFDFRAPHPVFRELAGVADAMNDMAGQLGDVFDEQLHLIEDLRQASFVDPLTGLSNREGFDGRMKTELDSQQHTAQGSLVLVQLNDFGVVNESLGRDRGDALLKSVAKILQKYEHRHQNAFAARRSGADFSLFLPSVMDDDIDNLIPKIMAEVCSLSDIKHLLRDDSVHIGAACVRTEDTARTLLSKADLALRKAQSDGISGWRRFAHIQSAEETMRDIHQANEWRNILQDVLLSRDVKLHTQSVFDDQGTLMYQQVLSRIEVNGDLVVAGTFLPMAERFGLMVPFDQLVVEKVLACLSNSCLSNPGDAQQTTEGLSHNNRNNGYFCVTLSEPSLIDERFLGWFAQQLEQQPSVAERLVVEVPEHIVSYNEEALTTLSEMAKELGFSISIERFGVSSVPFSYLQRVDIDFIKVDHSFIRDVQGSQSNQFFLRSAIQIAHGQAIKVIAVGVESNDEWQVLKELGIDGAMGYLLERPRANEIFESK